MEKNNNKPSALILRNWSYQGTAVNNVNSCMFSVSGTIAATDENDARDKLKKRCDRLRMTLQTAMFAPSEKLDDGRLCARLMPSSSSADVSRERPTEKAALTTPTPRRQHLPATTPGAPRPEPPSKPDPRAPKGSSPPPRAPITPTKVDVFKEVDGLLVRPCTYKAPTELSQPTEN